ncbi:MAG: COX15/CtaA family protein, partial [Candidatus Thermoplasmatota archaeon]|nr:COX15/CtaA family protein [Candidatus Thermoplasmatota archaeon]
MAVWYRSHQVPFMLVIIAFMIIATGGWVRISDAGESCPDWPTCFGTWGFDVSAEDQEKWWEENPDEVDSRGAEHRYTSDQIFTEWLHRGLVGIIGILVLYSQYTAWALRDEIGEKIYKIHFLVTVLLVMQAVVGYITVDLDNAPWTVALHLFMALMFTS